MASCLPELDDLVSELELELAAAQDDPQDSLVSPGLVTGSERDEPLLPVCCGIRRCVIATCSARSHT